jgi:hypothetical protein
MWDDGRYTRLDVPGVRATAAADINNRGQIVGDVKDAAGRVRGFLRTRDTYSLVDGPGDRTDSIAVHTYDRGDILIPAPARSTPSATASPNPRSSGRSSAVPHDHARSDGPTRCDRCPVRQPAPE